MVAKLNPGTGIGTGFSSNTACAAAQFAGQVELSLLLPYVSDSGKEVMEVMHAVPVVKLIQCEGRFSHGESKSWLMMCRWSGSADGMAW